VNGRNRTRLGWGDAIHLSFVCVDGRFVSHARRFEDSIRWLTFVVRERSKRNHLGDVTGRSDIIDRAA
jgi:hypothetical protein